MMSITPEYLQHEEYQNRKRKLGEIRELGIDPYPASYKPQDTAQKLQTTYGHSAIGHSEDAAAGSTQTASVAGRLILFRAMGKNAFGHIQDASGRIQIMFNRDLTQVTGYTPQGEEALSPFKFIEKKIDLGDIIGIEGNLFHTNKGELTIFAKRVTLLCKTLLPLPDKHAGLSDKEQRYRKRWLDLIANEHVKNTFLLRTQILRFVRKFLDDAHFTEVETPILQSVYGGAEARPFLTKLNALDQEMFMRISLEPSLKKLIVGGIDRVYEIGKVFRNEGIDRSHNPEFTLMEAYASYWDYKDMMVFCENLFEKMALHLYGTTEVPALSLETQQPIKIDFKAPWKRLTMKESLIEYAKINPDDLTDQEMREMLLASETCDPKKITPLTRGLLIAALFETFVEQHLIQPHHITDHPIETAILCKPKANEEGLIERFESFVLGGEICNAYSELNDPELQRKLFDEQSKRRDSGDEEASPVDEEFIEAIHQGMPPTGGIGIGIDRLVMLLTNEHSIRDVLYFPWMKPQ
ncbi:Lysine--tRNA ligase [Parachlamydia acanthamoebae]|uniref:Lysine--tRNA ligase n=2 Tax=Parachlamydiaceae TaxID=92713 RepID=A0A0C1E912_9BACT|nr:Lysine--tRNA ligase [Parachlamydia acanthamoebae]